MREIAVGDIWMWEPSPNAYNKWATKEYWLISRQDEEGEWWAISLSCNGDAGQEVDITVADISVDWTKVA